MDYDTAYDIVDRVARARNWTGATRERALSYLDDVKGLFTDSLDVSELVEKWPSDPNTPGWDKLGDTWRSAAHEARSVSLVDNVLEQAGEFGDDVSDFSSGVARVGAATTNVAEAAGQSPNITIAIIAGIVLLFLIVAFKLR